MNKKQKFRLEGNAILAGHSHAHYMLL